MRLNIVKDAAVAARSQETPRVSGSVSQEPWMKTRGTRGMGVGHPNDQACVPYEPQYHSCCVPFPCPSLAQVIMSSSSPRSPSKHVSGELGELRPRDAPSSRAAFTSYSMCYVKFLSKFKTLA